jgi:rhodanese-related sulfurtransferase
MYLIYRHQLAALLLIALFAISTAYACPNSPIKDIQVNAIEDFIAQEQDVVILDVRTPEEYTASHIEGAINVNIAADTFANNIAKLDRGKTYIVHCGANVENGRSDQSFEIMTDLGFTKLRNMQGGIAEWEASGQPLVKNNE